MPRRTLKDEQKIRCYLTSHFYFLLIFSQDHFAEVYSCSVNSLIASKSATTGSVISKYKYEMSTLKVNTCHKLHTHLHSLEKIAS